ncbi:Transmembrane protein 179B [Dissostichus eleginoides]|uniref:Transmembrane protein 179B n=1 Tax=Dissostichus eleginoides TaxID=100907 RepID=A0AAD9F5X4_DISEL|nr:Transmembrane protein 179B [Dissostichus eleginoides]
MVLPGLLLLELALYSSCFICGIVTAASITIVQGNFGGRCMLYGLVNYNATASLIGVQSSSPPSLCYFVSAISVLVALPLTCCLPHPPPPPQTAVWVNFFFWITIGVLVVLQRRQSSVSKIIAAGFPGYGGAAGGLFGDAGVTAAETEPFFNNPASPQ